MAASVSSLLVCRRAGLLLRGVGRSSVTNVWSSLYEVTSSSPNQLRAVISCQQHRQLFGFGKKKAEKVKETAADTEGENGTIKEAIAVEPTATFREGFIPITRRSVVRHLMQQPKFLGEEETKRFEAFSLALDSAVINRYSTVLQELKSLFDPINPDKDTIVTRMWNRRERLDNEFWLLQKLADVMEKGNFHEIPRATILKAFQEHEAREGVLVSVDPDRYDVMRMWSLGRDIPNQKIPVYIQLFNMALRKPNPPPLEYYKRVVVAVRLRKDDKLLLKAFKEVPTNALEQLVPDGQIKMSKLDQGIISASLLVASTGILAKYVTYLAQLKVNWTLLVTAITGAVAIRAFQMYHNRRNKYLLDLNKMLYFKNIANNRGLLTLLVDRAEDELFKEILLTYTFLLTKRSPATSGKGSSDNLPAEIGGLTQKALEQRVETWVQQKTGELIEFDSNEAVRVLKDLAILSEDYDQNLYVLPLETAGRNLPLARPSIAADLQEYDIVEGYETDIMNESEEDYKKEDNKRKWFGWF